MDDNPQEINIGLLAQEWSERLRNCQYAGELVVPENYLSSLAAAIRNELFSARRSSCTETCLFVLAVNCMYYYHDEEGFWAHFCRLLDIQDDVSTQSWFGNMLEFQLLNCGFLQEPRSGPFRYVSPLKEQCGITRQEIPRFTKILKSLSERYGWDGIRTIDRDFFNKHVSSQLQSGHLLRFMKEDSGWYFTRAVARTVSQHQRGVLNLAELEHLPGYRTGFFVELTELLDSASDPSIPSVTNPPLPRLVFSPEYCQIALLFDQQSVNKRAYKFDDEMVTRSLMILNSKAQFASSISGNRRNSINEWSEWKISGWNPRLEPVGLFHVDRGYIVDFQHNIKAGEYYMLAEYKNPPPEELQVSFYRVELPFQNLEYDAWRIVIDESTDLTFLGIEGPKIRTISELIKWSNESNQLSGTFEIEKTFVKELPSILLKRPDLFINNEVALFVDYGNKVQKKKIIEGQALVNLDLSPPVRGRIWAEPISRMREFEGLDTLGELKFCLLPECSIKCPKNLQRDIDQPEIHLISDDQTIKLALENAVPVDEKCKVWKVNSGVTVVEGKLLCGKIFISLIFRIFRAAIRKHSKLNSYYLLDTDFNEPNQIIAAGYPKQPVFIFLLNGFQATPLGQVGVFNDAGECHFSTYALRDALKHFREPVGLFAIKFNDKIIETKTFFINCNVVCQYIVSTDDNQNPSWWLFLPDELKKVLSLLLKLKSEPLRELPPPNKETKIPEFIRNYFETLLVCAAVFDKAYLPEFDYEESEQIIARIHDSNPEVERFLSWYLHAMEFYDAEMTCGLKSDESLLAQYRVLKWKPPFKRWRKNIRDILRNLREDKDVISILEEWCRDVKKGYRPSYSSRIAHQSGGRELTQAWITYRNENFNSAYQKAKFLTSNTASPVVDLAAILLRICLLRLAYFKSQPPIIYDSSNLKLNAAYNDLLEIVNFGANQNSLELPVVPHLAELLSVLPLSEKDSKTLKAFAAPKDFSESCGEIDWLSCYYMLLLAKGANMQNRKKYLAGLMKIILIDVPGSPDKNFIIDITEECS